MTARPIPGGRDPTPGHPPSDPSEAEQATADSLDTERVRLLAIRFGEELRRRRREAGLHQHDLADRIAYHRSYLSQVERGRQVPAAQFAMLCDQALEAGGALMGMFRELADEREARRREVAAERWRKRFHASSDAPAEAIAVPEAALSKLAGASLSSSDTSMERRPFVRMVGTFASAAMLEALGVDLLNLLRAMQGSRVSRPMLEETELAILRFHQLYKELPPTELFPYVRDHLQAVTGSLESPSRSKFGGGCARSLDISRAFEPGSPSTWGTRQLPTSGTRPLCSPLSKLRTKRWLDGCWEGKA